ncbi:MAG: DUF1611 domain-containing protein [Pseudomonadota bacterium]
MLDQSVRRIKRPYLLFLGDADPELGAKTAQGIAYWRPELCIGQLSLPDCAVSVGLEEINLAEAVARGAKSLVIGVASHGGIIAPSWIPTLCEALRNGLDIVNGLHERTSDNAVLAKIAEEHGRQLHDVRHTDFPIPVASGKKRSGKRLLTVGTDCAVGKMYTTLALHRAMNGAGKKTHLCTTGQTGIMIAGFGIAIDAVVADFISGAAELLAPSIPPDEWQVIEGQGSLFHPSFAGVTLGLVHGAQPDAMILCHNPSRTGMNGAIHFPLPELDICIAAYETAARLTNPSAKVIGVSLNTNDMTDEESLRLIDQTSNSLGLPCADPVRTGIDVFLPHIAKI